MRRFGTRTRRGFLALSAGLGGGIALSGLPFGVWRLSVGSTAESRGRGLSASDLLIACLGEHLESEDPSTADRLHREIDAQLPSWSFLASRRRRATLVRERFLDRRRRDADLDREDIIQIDGWVLARSEAAAAVYFHRLAGSQSG